MSNENDIQWALDLLTPDPLYEENFLSKNFHWIAWPILTCGGVAFSNFMRGRPFYASLPKYGIAFVAALVLADTFKKAKTHRESERDQVLRHYIKLHPEDFPPPERIQYKDYLQPWFPAR